MGLREDIENQYIKSIKDKNSNLTNTLRLIKSAIKDKDIEARGQGNKEKTSDKELLDLLQTLVKQRKDSIDSFEIAGRKDLIEKEKEEIGIIKNFLPEQKSEKETEILIEELLTEHNLNSLKDMGKLMSLLKAKYSNQIDMGQAGKIAKTKLSS